MSVSRLYLFRCDQEQCTAEVSVEGAATISEARVRIKDKGWRSTSPQRVNSGGQYQDWCPDHVAAANSRRWS